MSNSNSNLSNCWLLAVRWHATEHVRSAQRVVQPASTTASAAAAAAAAAYAYCLFTAWRPGLYQNDENATPGLILVRELALTSLLLLTLS
jgi:hypothetical protein